MVIVQRDTAEQVDVGVMWLGQVERSEDIWWTGREWQLLEGVMEKAVASLLGYVCCCVFRQQLYSKHGDVSLSILTQ